MLFVYQLRMKVTGRLPSGLLIEFEGSVRKAKILLVSLNRALLSEVNNEPKALGYTGRSSLAYVKPKAREAFLAVNVYGDTVETLFMIDSDGFHESSLFGPELNRIQSEP